jgi:excisionase family DNA binding protein
MFPDEPHDIRNSLPVLLTVPEAARFLRIGINRAYQLCRSRTIPTVVIGHSVRVPRDALERWVAEGGWEATK